MDSMLRLSLSLGFCLAALGLLQHSDPNWQEHLDTSLASLPRVHTQIKDAVETQGILDPQQRAVFQRIEGKRAIAHAIAEQRMSLLEAARRFQVLEARYWKQRYATVTAPAERLPLKSACEEVVAFVLCEAAYHKLDRRCLREQLECEFECHRQAGLLD